MSQNSSLLNPALSLQDNLANVGLKEKLDRLNYLSQIVCVAAIQAANNRKGQGSISPEDLQVIKDTIEEFNKLAAELIK